MTQTTESIITIIITCSHRTRGRRRTKAHFTIIGFSLRAFSLSSPTTHSNCRRISERRNQKGKAMGEDIRNTHITRRRQKATALVQRHECVKQKNLCKDTEAAAPLHCLLHHTAMQTGRMWCDAGGERPPPLCQAVLIAILAQQVHDDVELPACCLLSLAIIPIHRRRKLSEMLAHEHTLLYITCSCLTSQKIITGSERPRAAPTERVSVVCKLSVLHIRLPMHPWPMLRPTLPGVEGGI